MVCCSIPYILFLLSLVFFPSKTLQLEIYETQILLQLRKHLEYPIPLKIWDNFNSDLCKFPSTPQLTLKCQNDSVTELKITGDYYHNHTKNTQFNGFAIQNQTLSQSFSIDSFIVTLTRLPSLRILSLVSLGIWGELPDKIHRLYSLESLDLSSNFIFGSIPYNISRLVKMRKLQLDDNFFTDTIPEWFDSMKNLSTLSLKNNGLKGKVPFSLSKIESLTEIVLSNNLLSGKIPDLSVLSNLRLLDLRENSFNSELPFLPKGIVNVFLSGNSFSGDIPLEFSTLIELQRLDLSSNFLTGTPPGELFALPSISYLNLSCNVFSSSLEENLKCGNSLTLVDLSENRFVGRVPSCLTTDSENRIVQIRGNCFSVDDGNQNPAVYCKGVGKGKRGSKLKMFAVLVGGMGVIVILVVILLVLGLVLFCKRRWNSVELIEAKDVVKDDRPSGTSSEILANARIVSEPVELATRNATAYSVFSIDELKNATNNFDRSTLLGQGSIGEVYKGMLENGTLVAIRSLTLHRKYSIRNLKHKLDLLSKLRHHHLVRLLGHCIDEGLTNESTTARLFLVYEFVPNGNLCSHLTETCIEKVHNWPDRLSVLIGVAKAGHFLHTGVIPPCLSNGLKSNNILIDENGIAKLTDYGMSIIADEIEKSQAKENGTKLRHAAKLDDDVYSFGFILLKSLLGPSVRENGEDVMLNKMVSLESQESWLKIIDPIVLTTGSVESLSIVLSLACKCTSPEISIRPSFADVLWNLQYAAQVQTTADAEQKSDTMSQSEVQLT